VGVASICLQGTSMSDIVLNNGKIKSSIIVEVGDPNSSVPGVSGTSMGIWVDRSWHDQSLL
jgi:hypothetical protein